ncbi:N-acetylmuramoyl-L-alanine amidase [Rhizobium sp.]|uniref:N-acetylmuramoyl-L-alanine amidase n=1 Tax=Rhizobium sp. TaxID=391 RepID=UPI000E84FF70|nr:N-acetylmuramoyl-L-alanine amidase [Rhizobium sp.]
MNAMRGARAGMRWFACLIIAIASLQLASFRPALAEAPLTAFAARIAGDNARTRIILDFREKPEATVRYIGNPDRIVVDLPATNFSFPTSALAPQGLFRDIRFGSIDATHARLVLTAQKPTKLVLTDIRKNDEGEGYRLILEAEVTDSETFAKLVASEAWNAAAYNRGKEARIEQDPPPSTTDFVIAVDAGHGGIDTGAIGRTTHVAEKTITLAYAKALVADLNKKPGIKAFLTRDADVFLSLSERVTLARQKGANLFISLHADMLSQPNIRGATVYTISDTASDRLAEAAAARENQSDEVGGVDTPVAPHEVSDILQDLTRRETQAFSISMAKAVVNQFEGQIKLINNPHRYAGFRVLQAQDVPSILLEMGFLSNKQDEELLSDPAWRKKLVKLLVDAVEDYRKPLLANGG